MKLRDGLREADRAFQTTPLPADAQSRLRRRVLADRPVRWPRFAVAGLAVAAAVAVAVVLVYRPAPAVEEDVQLAAGKSYSPAAPRGVDVVASAASRLHRDHDRVRVLSGTVTFSVAKRGAGEAPVRVDVSHGTIEVVGTRFTIRQGEAGGDVTLHEGVIRFGSHTLHAGESLAWPEAEAVRVPAPEPVPAPEEPTPAPKAPHHRAPHREPAVIHETDVAWLLEEVDTSRSRAEYAEAVRLLDKGLDGIVSPASRERFSFELGSILTWQVKDRDGACARWAKHEAAFPGGRYAQAVAAAKEHLRCGP